MSPAALVFSTLLLAAAGKPPSADEQRLFEEGMKAMQAGDAAAADKAWRAGYAIAKDPAFLVHMGEAEEKAGQPAEAGESYRRYLRAAPDASDRAEIEQRLTRLGPAGAPPAAPADTHEVPGAFGEGPPPGMPGGPPPPPPRTVGSPVRDYETGRRPGAEEDSGWNAYNITAWVATGATVMLLGTAGYFAASAASEKDDVNQLLRFADPVTGAPLEYQPLAARYETAVRNGQHDDRVAKDALFAAAGTALVATAFFIIDAYAGDAARGDGASHARRERQRGPVRARRATTPVFGFSLRPEEGGGGGSARGAKASAFSSLRWSF
jgi:hypothetical protein